MKDGGQALSEREFQVLRGMHEDADDDFAYLNFMAIAARSKVERQHIRRTVRALARKGCAEYGRGLWTEDGEPYGSGYRITDVGRLSLAERDKEEQ